MATNLAERQSYPFSTRDATPIPLDVIDPTGIVYHTLATTGYVTGTIPANMELGFIWSETGCFIEFGNTITDPPVTGSVWANALFVPPGVMLSIKYGAGTYRIVSMGRAGKVVLQSVVKWATLSLQQQTRII